MMSKGKQKKKNLPDTSFWLSLFFPISLLLFRFVNGGKSKNIGYLFLLDESKATSANARSAIEENFWKLECLALTMEKDRQDMQKQIQSVGRECNQVSRQSAAFNCTHFSFSRHCTGPLWSVPS